MVNKRIKKQIQRNANNVADHNAGLPYHPFKMTGSYSMILNVANTDALPAKQVQRLQDDDGNFYFVAGYSQAGGPDIIR